MDKDKPKDPADLKFKSYAESVKYHNGVDMPEGDNEVVTYNKPPPLPPQKYLDELEAQRKRKAVADRRSQFKVVNGDKS